MLSNRPWIRVLPLAVALAATTPLQACFGKFALTTKVWEFNRDVSSSFVVQEIVFLAFIIVPVYGVTTFIDAIILNTIEAFSGSNPIAMAERESQTIALDDGSTLTLTWTERGLWIEQDPVDGEASRHLLKQDDTGMQLLEEDGTLVGATHRLDDGTFELVDGEGHLLAHPGRSMLADLDSAWMRGGVRGMVAETEAYLRTQETRLAFAD